MNDRAKIDMTTNGHSQISSITVPLSAMQATAAFGEIVGLLMRSARHRHHALAELEWMVLPALVNNQFLIGERVDATTGMRSPSAMILWAMVSEDLDKRLCSDPAARLTLRPEEWKSGPIPWFVNGAGDQHAIVGLAKFLVGERFEDIGLKLVGAGADGKPVVGVLRAVRQSAATQKRPAPQE